MTHKPLDDLIQDEESKVSYFWNLFAIKEINSFPKRMLKASWKLNLKDFTFEPGIYKELMNWSGYYPPILLSILNNLYLCDNKQISTNTVIEKAKYTIDNNDRKMNFLLGRVWDSCKAEEKDLFKHIIYSEAPPRTKFSTIKT